MAHDKLQLRFLDSLGSSHNIENIVQPLVVQKRNPRDFRYKREINERKNTIFYISIVLAMEYYIQF